jgi:hypothetical protein
VTGATQGCMSNLKKCQGSTNIPHSKFVLRCSVDDRINHPTTAQRLPLHDRHNGRQTHQTIPTSSLYNLPRKERARTDSILNQVRYAAQHIPTAKSARSRGSYLRVSFKNTRETAQAINGWKLGRATKYLENVMEMKEAVPMRRYAGSTGRSAQGTLG